MLSKRCYLDFEYNGTSEEILNLVSCSYATNRGESYTVWLHKSDNNKKILKEKLEFLDSQGYVFVAYAVTAEARSMLYLGMEVTKLKFVDLYLEYRFLTNHNHKLMYGKQLIDGKIKTTYPPKSKWDMHDGEKQEANNSKPRHSLASSCYKLLNITIDTDHKDFIRDIIIEGRMLEENKDKILEYNESDIAHLPKLINAILTEYKELLDGEVSELPGEMLVRGNYGARTALMESLGYPIDRESTSNFARSVPAILWEVQNEINGLFPGVFPFRKRSDRGFSWNQNATREWISGLSFASKWDKTETKKHSLSLDAFQRFFKYRHDFPKDCLGAQLVRYLILRRNLNGFTSGKTKNSFWDYVGTDNRVRPYFGIYGAQSARSQPKATGFLFLKSAWMRALCSPVKGRAICGIDYKSQEFLLAALMSGDANMIKAYRSGDPYLYLAKLAKAVPMDAVKKDYPKERNIFKTVTLALQYGMGANALAIELTPKLGEEFTKDRAESVLKTFN